MWSLLLVSRFKGALKAGALATPFESRMVLGGAGGYYASGSKLHSLQSLRIASDESLPVQGATALGGTPWDDVVLADCPTLVPGQNGAVMGTAQRSGTSGTRAKRRLSVRLNQEHRRLVVPRESHEHGA